MLTAAKLPLTNASWIVSSVLALAVAAAPHAAAQSPKVQDPKAQDSKDRGDVVRQIETGKDTLRQSERRITTLQTDVQQLDAEQAKVNQQLIEIGRLAQNSEVSMSLMEARLGELDAQEKLIRGSLAARHDKIAKLFSAMQRMGRNPPPVIVTQRDDALQMVRSAMLLARAFPELKTQAEDLSRRLQDLVRVTTDIRSESDRLKAETQRLTDARTRLAALVESKRRSLSERQHELEEVRRSAAEIARSVGDLSDLIAKLDKSVAEHTGLGAYDRELREREIRDEQTARDAKSQAALKPPPTPSQPSATTSAPARTAEVPATAPMRSTSAEAPIPALRSDVPPAGTQTAMVGARPQPPRVALEPHGALASNAGRMKPAIPFHLAKGQLPYPATGRRVLSFGEKNQFGRTSRGIVIETRPGGTVVSPSDGWVVYAGEFRSYGQVLIINAGGGYHILLANLARAEVEVGRFVLAGEPVGAMSSNVIGNNKDATPVLYVEFRNKDGQSIDPASWWADGSQKVQG